MQPIDWQPFINAGLMGAFALVGWVGRTFYTDIRDLEKSIAAHKQHVAETYAPNSDIKEIKTELGKIFDLLIRLLERSP